MPTYDFLQYLLFLVSYFFLTFVYIHVCRGVCASECKCNWAPEEGARFPGPGLTSGCELPGVVAGNLTPFLYKNRKHSQPRHLSSQGSFVCFGFCCGCCCSFLCTPFLPDQSLPLRFSLFTSTQVQNNVPVRAGRVGPESL